MSPGLCYNVCMSCSGLLELVKLYLSLKINVKPTTEAGYKTVLNILEKHNKIYKKELPKITPHVCRHTYCTNKAKSGMNPKTLQYLMGHSDISVTMNTYTHLGLQDAWEELQRLQLEYSQRELGLKKDAPALKLVKTA